MTTLIVTGARLHEAAAWASRATPAKAVVPVLSGLLLDATGEDGTELVVTGYDFDARASVTLPATVTTPGRVVVSARLLAAIAKTVARDVDVHLCDDTGPLVVTCARSEWKLPTLPVEDYPQLPELPAPVGAVAGGELRRALGQVLPTLGRDDALPMLTALRLESDGDELTLTGTDRYRLATTTIGWSPAPGTPSLAVNLPGGVLDTALRGVAQADTGTVSLAVADSQFALSTDTHLAAGRVLAVDYPRWRPLLVPPNPDRHAVVEVADLLHAVEQAVVASDNAQLTLAFDGDTVEVSAGTADARGTARAAVPAKLVGDPITIGVMTGYLRDAITLPGSDTVTIHFGSSPTRPVSVRGEDGRYQHTLMPVRIAGQS
jgi:DNA polymerase-3 subunit beta